MPFGLFGKKELKIEEVKKGLSRQYLEFIFEEQKQRELRNWFEKYCKFAERLRIAPPQKLEEKFKLDIVFSSLNVTPLGVFSASIFTLLIGIVLLGVMLLLPPDFGIDQSALVMIGVMPIGIFWYIFTYPSFQSHVTRIQAGDEAIKIVLYMVIYLKLNPSFEGAVNFAVAHAKGPITRDIKKSMWDLSIGKYRTVEEALSVYTQKWAWWNEDFIRSLSLLYGVLIEPTEAGREGILKKALGFILESTQLKMKRYVEDISGPIMMLHAMGLLLPAIGLIMFPMISIFMSTQVNVWTLILGYTVALPLFDLFFIMRILAKRPSAFLVPDISKHPDLPPEDYYVLKIGKTKTFLPVAVLAVLIGAAIMLYGILHFIDLSTALAYPTREYALNVNPDCNDDFKKCILLAEADINPRTLASTFSITAGVGAIFIIYYYSRSVQRIKIRNEIKNIEAEFQIGLFTLGNFLSEGYPIEVCMEKSLDEYNKLGMQKRPIYNFFLRLQYNIKNFGMTFKRALYDREYGLLKYYPSVLIDEIMRILSDASEKSALLLGTIAKTIATYLENVYAIEAKIRELLDEVRSAIRMQASFIIPMVTAMVGALGIFILKMLQILATRLADIEKQFQVGGLGQATDLMQNLVGDFTKVVPMTVLQATVGIYTVEVVALFAMLLSGIENGFDKVARDWEISQCLIRALVVYGLVNIFALIMFQGVIVSVVGGV